MVRRGGKTMEAEMERGWERMGEVMVGGKKSGEGKKSGSGEGEEIGREIYIRFFKI